MFIIAHFHTQPARNNHLSVCVCDRERGIESTRDTEEETPKDNWKRDEVWKQRQNKEN